MKNLKTFIALACLICFSFNSNLNAQSSIENGSTLQFENAETSLELIKNYIAALEKGDVATMKKQLADNATIYGLGGGADSLSVQQHQEYFTNSTDVYTHTINNEVFLPVKNTDSEIVPGEWVLVWGWNVLKNKETGNEIVIPFHIANRIENGKIAMAAFYYDMANIMQKQGFTISPPKE